MSDPWDDEIVDFGAIEKDMEADQADSAEESGRIIQPVKPSRSAVEVAISILMVSAEKLGRIEQFSIDRKYLLAREVGSQLKQIRDEILFVANTLRGELSLPPGRKVDE